MAAKYIGDANNIYKYDMRRARPPHYFIIGIDNIRQALISVMLACVEHYDFDTLKSLSAMSYDIFKLESRTPSPPSKHSYMIHDILTFSI